MATFLLFTIFSSLPHNNEVLAHLDVGGALHQRVHHLLTDGSIHHVTCHTQDQCHSTTGSKAVFRLLPFTLMLLLLATGYA